MAASLLSSPLSLSRLALFLNSSFPRVGARAPTSLFARPRHPSISSSPPPLKPALRPLSASFNPSDDLVVLGIETSCDDTAAAVVRGNGEILSQVVSSQADLLARYGGVAPKMAEEAHSLVIDQVVQQALNDANLTGKNLSAVAVTIGPGLSLCLRVGVHKARRVAGMFNLPIVGVHHMEAHTLVARF